MPTVYNAANEAAVAGFLKGKTGFLDIPRIISEAMDRHEVIADPDVDTVISLGAETVQNIIDREGF